MWRRPRPRRCVKTPVVVFVAENVRRFFSVPATDTECSSARGRDGRSRRGTPTSASARTRACRLRQSRSSRGDGTRMSPWPHKADDPSRRPQMKKRKGHASVLHAADVRRVVTERVAANGPERVSLRGRALADADAVQAVCDAVLALGQGGPNDGDSMTSPSPTVTLNLASGNVCGAGASRLAAFLLDPRCAVRELNLLDNPRLGVHLAEVADCPPAHAVEHTESDKVVDGFGCLALAAALQSPNCSLTRLNLGGCGLTCGGVSALASALMGDAPRDRNADVSSVVGLSHPEKDFFLNDVGETRRGSPSPRLLSINLRSNDVGYAGVVDLARAARAHGGVREMALGNNENVSDDAIRELEEVLRENRRNALVAELRDAAEAARSSGSGPEETIFSSERESEDVRRAGLSLRRRHLRDEDAGTIAAALRPGGVADTLERLDLSDNELTAFGIDVLTHAIRGVAGNASLTHVSVAGNPGAHHDGGDAVRAESIANAMRLTDPRSLDARFKEGSKEGSKGCGSKEGQKQKKTSAVAPFTVAARALHGAVAVNFLSRCGAGEALRSIADRGLGNEGAQEVAAAVSATAVYARDDRSWAFALESVGTQHNDIGAPGAEALAEAFSQLPNLKEWACYANPFGAGGARALARALAAPGRFQRLEVLDIGGCGIADAGCVAIAEAIVGHARLRELHLDHNELGETGGLALLGSMRRTEETSPRGDGDFSKKISQRVVGVQRVWLHGNPRVPDAVVARVHALAGRTAARADARSIGGGPEFEPAPVVEPAAATAAAEARCAADAERLARRVYGTRSKHPTDTNRRVDSSALFADRVAAHATVTYRHRCPEHHAATRGAAVVAAVVAHEAARGAERGTPGGDDALVTVAMGVGTKFMPGPVAAAAAAGGEDAWAKVVHDSHAEVLARRALLRLLNREMRELARLETEHGQNEKHPGWPTAAPDARIQNDSSGSVSAMEKFRVLECTGDGQGFRVRGNVTLHLYVSTAPCGAASAAAPEAPEAPEAFVRELTERRPQKKPGLVATPDFDPRRSGFDPGPFLAATLPPKPGPYVRSSARPRDVVEYDLDDVAYAEAFREDAVRGRHENGVYASARASSRRAMRKGSVTTDVTTDPAPAPGCVTLRSLREAFGNPGVTLACSDKIAKWQVLGAQGAALSLLVPAPVAFASVVVGRKFDGDALRLGTCCRSAGFPHEVFRLPKPKHLAALRTAVKIESDELVPTEKRFSESDKKKPPHRASFIADARRADAGDSDESLTWCRGELSVTRHDGRTGTAVGGGGPVPTASRAWAFRDVSETLRVVRASGRNVLDVQSGENAALFHQKTPQGLKAMAKTYAAARHALIRGNVPPTSALAAWRGNQPNVKT